MWPTRKKMKVEETSSTNDQLWARSDSEDSKYSQRNSSTRRSFLWFVLLLSVFLSTLLVRLSELTPGAAAMGVRSARVKDSTEHQQSDPTTEQYPRILMASYVFGESAYSKGYFRPFLESLRYAGIDVAIVGSPAPPFELPPNVKHIKIGWEEFYANALERMFPGEDMKDIVASRNKYKVIDFKPLFAFLFPEAVKGYDWWGHLDCDMLVGDVPHFLTREFLEEYDIVAGNSFNNGYPTWGPFTIYRNTPQLNELFRLGDIRYIFTNQTAFAFDEWGFNKYADISMSSIILKNYERLGLRFARTGQPRAWDGYKRNYTECSVITSGDRPKLLSDESDRVEGCEPHSTAERCNKEIMLCHYQWAKKKPAWDTLAKSVAAVDDEDWKRGFRMSDIRGLVI